MTNPSWPEREVRIPTGDDQLLGDLVRPPNGNPQLPSGYASMVLLAYVPWLWSRVMNPRVVAYYGGDMRRANIQPRAPSGS